MEYKQFSKTKENIIECCVNTLSEVWQCINWDKIDKRRALNIYDEFSSKVKAAAMTTNNFETFINKLGIKFEIRSYKSKILDEIYDQSDDFHKEMLKKFRNPLVLILKLRLKNQKKLKAN